MGKVILVGGGPGDEGLITVKGLEAIKKADCIIYDRLSSLALLDNAKKDCELIYAGKENHHHTLKQDEINALLVEKSKKYTTVVRLKGGDVYVFGRGGEEGAYLRDNGVEFEVIPGVTSAIAGLAYAGIPVTNRKVATGFRVVTAHNRLDELADIDFASIVKNIDKETCVFLMGLSKLGEITEKLKEAGAGSNVSMAVISNATTPAQKTCIGNVEDICEKVKKADIKSPALIVAGEVVLLRDKLNFYEEKPLFQRKYIVTKVGMEKSHITTLLENSGAYVKEIMTGEIENVYSAFDDTLLDDLDWCLFTSRNGVKAFFEKIGHERVDLRKLSNIRFAVVGDKTYDLLAGYGIYADMKSSKADGETFANELRTYVKKDDKVCFFKADTADDTVERILKDFCTYNEIIIYRNVDKIMDDRNSVDNFNEYDGVFFTCASSVKRFFERYELDAKAKEKLNCFSIGAKTTKELKGLGIKNVLQAEKPDYVRLCKLVL